MIYTLLVARKESVIHSVLQKVILFQMDWIRYVLMYTLL